MVFFLTDKIWKQTNK